MDIPQALALSPSNCYVKEFSGCCQGVFDEYLSVNRSGNILLFWKGVSAAGLLFLGVCAVIKRMTQVADLRRGSWHWFAESTFAGTFGLKIYKTMKNKHLQSDLSSTAAALAFGFLERGRVC